MLGADWLLAGGGPLVPRVSHFGAPGGGRCQRPAVLGTPTARRIVVGFDAALSALAVQQHGTALLLPVAAGLACIGVRWLCDARSRSPRSLCFTASTRGWPGVDSRHRYGGRL
jgi:hypothetical protein